MERMDGKYSRSAAELKDVTGGRCDGQQVTVSGMVHALRDMGGITFLTLRGPESVLQCVCDETVDLQNVTEECAVKVTGIPREEKRAPGGVELGVSSLSVLSRPAEPLPVPVSKRKLDLNMDTELSLRPVVVRNLKERSIFRIQEALCRAFRDTLYSLDFTEIHTPKIVHAGAEGGSNIFRLDYFGRKAFLAQSPQFYKQTMVGAYERVFEVAPVFRAEKHSTARHLNEYTSMDFEMGFIESFTDIMEVETLFLQNAMELIRTEYADDVQRLGIQIP
ncbi:MAG: OB-fold nucleic acid binding domain-containing protein, partial [Clostridiales bacterium]|nr:OB-fold nucleic acid binding domain-containing protein [Clostridiales bacterium]